MKLQDLVTHGYLVERAAKWLLNKRCGLVLKEYNCNAWEIPDTIGFKGNYSILIECKASRSDFLGDKNKWHRNGLNRKSMGNYRYYLVPVGMIAKEECPDGWGLLFAYPKKVMVIVESPHSGAPEIKAAEHPMLYSLLRRAEIRGLMPQILTKLPTEIEKEGGK